MDKLLEILQDLKPGVDFMKEDDLVEDGVLTSLEIMTLVVELCSEFGIEITPLDIVPENFKSIYTIDELIKRIGDEE
jgi:Phosphopantetheine attachment site.